MNDIPRKPMQVARRSIAQARTQQVQGERPNAFTLPKPPPGLFKAEAAAMAQDFGEFYSQMADYGGQDVGFPGYAALAQLAQRPEYRRISEIIAKEMTRRWVRLVANGGEDKTEKIRALTVALEKYDVQKVFREVAEHDGFFGKGQIYIDLGNDDPEELDAPLILHKAKIKKGGLKRLAAIEPIWSYPAGYDSTDPLSRNFYKPTHWVVYAKRVHRSRLLQFVSREVSDLLKPAYMFGGLSLTQMARPYVENWIRTRDNVGDLVESFSTMVLATDMSAVLSGGDGSTETSRAELMNALRSNRGLFMLNQDTEALSNVSAPLGGLDHLQAQAQEHIASVAGVPLIKLLGITPSGLNASSDGELRCFYDWIEATQKSLFAQHLKTIIDIIQLSEFGLVDEDIRAEFEPLWQMSEIERSTIRKTNADTADGYITAGVLLPSEERTRLASEDAGLYHGLDLATEPVVDPADPVDGIVPPETDDTPDDVPEAVGTGPSEGEAP